MTEDANEHKSGLKMSSVFILACVLSAIGTFGLLLSGNEAAVLSAWGAGAATVAFGVGALVLRFFSNRWQWGDF